MKRIFYWSSVVLLGTVLGASGLTIVTWQFWAVMVCVVGIALSIDY